MTMTNKGDSFRVSIDVEGTIPQEMEHGLHRLVDSMDEQLQHEIKALFLKYGLKINITESEG